MKVSTRLVKSLRVRPAKPSCLEEFLDLSESGRLLEAFQLRLCHLHSPLQAAPVVLVSSEDRHDCVLVTARHGTLGREVAQGTRDKTFGLDISEVSSTWPGSDSSLAGNLQSLQFSEFQSKPRP